MSQGNNEAFAIDRMLADELNGQAKLYALFKAKGWTYQSYAQHRRLWPEQVKHVMYGKRPYPEIRDYLAEDLGLSRQEIDRLIDGEKPAEVPATDPAA